MLVSVDSSCETTDKEYTPLLGGILYFTTSIEKLMEFVQKMKNTRLFVIVRFEIITVDCIVPMSTLRSSKYF